MSQQDPGFWLGELGFGWCLPVLLPVLLMQVLCLTSCPFLFSVAVRVSVLVLFLCLLVLLCLSVCFFLECAWGVLWSLRVAPCYQRVCEPQEAPAPNAPVAAFSSSCPLVVSVGRLCSFMFFLHVARAPVYCGCCLCGLRCEFKSFAEGACYVSSLSSVFCSS